MLSVKTLLLQRRRVREKCRRTEKYWREITDYTTYTSEPTITCNLQNILAINRKLEGIFPPFFWRRKQTSDVIINAIWTYMDAPTYKMRLEQLLLP